MVKQDMNTKHNNYHCSQQTNEPQSCVQNIQFEEVISSAANLYIIVNYNVKVVRCLDILTALNIMCRGIGILKLNA
jgi:hypothetical protein